MEREVWIEMIVYASSITNRLTYVTGFIGQQLTGSPLVVTNNKEEFSAFEGSRINYSHEMIAANETWIKPAGLLEESGIRPQAIECFELNGNKAFFKTPGDYPFDIFSSIFYLLSRYEEYLPYKKDSYGRYAHENSLAFKEGFLQVPLVNYWLKDFKNFLVKKAAPIPSAVAGFRLLPTYDIDEAWSFKYKQWWRSRGGAIRDLLSGKRERYAFRNKVLEGKAADPFDSYEWMDALHEKFVLHPHYFFLVAARTSRYDKNTLPAVPAFKELVAAHAKKYSLGVHPSWQSFGNPEVLKSEIGTLENLSGQKIISSRQHFIRFELPATYRNLIEAGILKDFSMGYGSINGFRASVAESFYWYDLEKEEQTALLLYPFCFMDANSFFEQKLQPGQALAEMREYYKTVSEVDGMMVTIWHNTFLGTDPLFEGWREVYEEFLNSPESRVRP